MLLRTEKLLQINVGAVQKGVGTDNAVGGNIRFRAAVSTGDADAVVPDFYAVVPVSAFAAAGDLLLRLQLMDHIHDDIHDLRIAEHPPFSLIFFGQIGDRGISEKLLQFPIGLLQRFVHLILLSGKADIHTGIGTGEGEELAFKKERRGNGEVVGIGAEKAGNRQPDLFVLGIHDPQLTLAAGAFQTQHIRRQGKHAHQAEYRGAAVRATVGDGRLFLVQYHNRFIQSVVVMVRGAISPVYYTTHLHFMSIPGKRNPGGGEKISAFFAPERVRSSSFSAFVPDSGNSAVKGVLPCS